MPPEDLRGRISDQFSYRGTRADVWRLFDLVLDTDAFLNLGYSAWYQPHASGASQRRLATELGRRIASRLSGTAGVRLVDVGCGRGGPTVHLADRFGFDATGVDLVPYNVARARENAREAGVDAEFVVGDATHLPFARDSIPACVGVDAFVYLPDRDAVFASVADALESGGVLVFSDLVVRGNASDAERAAVGRFADAWDMPNPGSRPGYERALADAGFDVVDAEDVSRHSVAQFRKWTTLFEWVYASPARRIVDWLLAWQGLNPAVVTEQIRRAHDALPALRHVVFVAET